jgi:hypothetical protein
MKYLKFEFPTEEQALDFVSAMEGIAYATIPKILPIEVSEEGEILSSTQWIVDVIGEDWRIPKGYSTFKVTPQNPVQMIAGMNEFYNT